MRGADLVELSSPSPRWHAKLRRALDSRLSRVGIHVARQLSRPRQPRGWPLDPCGTFAVSGLTATFEELERITFDPAIVSRAEAEPRVPLRTLDRPLPDLSGLAAALAWKPRVRPARIYDVVPFGFELDLLELRVAELHDVVDRFVVAEASRGFGGVGKPLYLQRNWSRFTAFHAQMTPIVIEDENFDQLYSSGRRDRTDWKGEDTLRTLLWQQVRHLALEPGAVVVWADVDELPPRWLLHLFKHYECPFPIRIQAPALKYHFGWSDPEATAGITIFDARSAAAIDPEPQMIRALPARTFAARGAVHLTSFLEPSVLLMKCTLTTDWEPGVLPYLRNKQGEIAGMMLRGTWFGRPLAPYDAEQDPLGIIPPTARLNRGRYASFWPELL